MSRHTLYSWKQKFEAEGPAGLVDKPRGAGKGSRLPELGGVFVAGDASAVGLEALQLSVSPTAPAPGASLTTADLDTAVNEAIAYLSGLDVDPLYISELEALHFQVADLTGSVLGTTQGSTITIDGGEERAASPFSPLFLPWPAKV